MSYYRNLNGVIKQSTDAIHKAYDNGYKQAQLDLQKIPTMFIPEQTKQGIRFRCKDCRETSIAYYPYCPWCGKPIAGRTNPREVLGE